MSEYDPERIELLNPQAPAGTAYWWRYDVASADEPVIDRSYWPAPLRDGQFLLFLGDIEGVYTLTSDAVVAAPIDAALRHRAGLTVTDTITEIIRRLGAAPAAEEAMTTTAAIEWSEVQADNGTHVRFTYTHVESGTMWTDNSPYRLDAQGPEDPNPGEPRTTAMLQAFGDSLTDTEERRKVVEEREFAYQVGITGGDPDLETYNFNELDTIRKYWFRRLFNEQRDDFPALDQKIVPCSEASFYYNKHNSPSIGGWVDDPAWGNTQVNSATSKRSAVGVNVPQLDHGLDELSLDDF